jgi:hypothetical protein
MGIDEECYNFTFLKEQNKRLEKNSTENNLNYCMELQRIPE